MFCLNQRLINAFKKAGLTAQEISNGYRVVSANGKRVVSWHVQDDKAVCVHCGDVNDKSDIMTDYFPGHFARTIKDAVSYLVKG